MNGDCVQVHAVYVQSLPAKSKIAASHDPKMGKSAKWMITQTTTSQYIEQWLREIPSF